MTRSILCYGDSNTWGYVPGTAARYARQVRWPGVLQTTLGTDYYVIEEGLNSRTTVMDDPTRLPLRNGLAYLGPCLDTHAPLDLVVLMLGTNDLKHRWGFSAADIAVNIAALVGVIQKSGVGQGGGQPALLLIAPPHIGPLTQLAGIFEGAEEKSRAIAGHYRAVATQANCRFFDAAEVVTASPIDGVHWDEEQHRKLGLRIAEIIREMIS